jgi:dolichol-phosphate mannosyltransferase
MKKISVVVPAYNEEGNVEELASQIDLVFQGLDKYDHKIIFVENGSTDNTFNVLQDLQKTNNRISIVKLSRNFKMDGGIAAGINQVDTDAAIIMTANLQDDPKVIPEFIELWEKGYNHIYGIVKSRPGKSPLRKFNSKFFYFLINKLTNGQIPKGVSDFRLVDKKVIAAVKELGEFNRFYRGFFSWVGFKSIGLEFERNERFSGKSHAATVPVLGFALKGIFAFSLTPLRISTFFALFLSASSITILGVQVFRWVRYGVPFDGFGTVVGILLLLIGFLFTAIAIMSEYIGLIYNESKNRPHFIVDEIY